MKTTFTRTITIKATADSSGTPLDCRTLEELKADSFRRLQRELGSLVDERFGSGSLCYQERQPSVNLNWTITVLDHPNALDSGPQTLG